MLSPRALAKTFMEKTLVHSGVCRFVRWVTRGHPILAYHNVVPTGAPIFGERSLHLPEEEFVRQLDRLQETHTIVPLRRLLFEGGKQDLANSLAAITFDDAYRGAMEIGLRHILDRGLSATVFVSPGRLGTDGFWWDLLADEQGVLDSDLRNEALTRYAGDHDAVTSWADCSGLALKSLPDYMHAADERQMLRIAKQPGIALESHGWDHVNLTALEPATCRSDCARAAAWINDVTGRSELLISYPYGIAPQKCEEAVASLYRAGLLITGGRYRPGACDSKYRIPRVNVPQGTSADGLILRVSGII